MLTLKTVAQRMDGKACLLCSYILCFYFVFISGTILSGHQASHGFWAGKIAVRPERR